VVELELDLASLASYNGETWLIEKGEYEIRVGASSRDIRRVGRFFIDDYRVHG